MAKPDLQQVPPFYHNYINLVKSDSLREAFKTHLLSLTSLLNNIPEERWGYRYAADKWSIKEVVQHIIDAERIFNYRALCIARKESASLPGFDENNYAAASQADARSKSDLVEELEAVQKSSLLLFKSFDEDQLNRTGTANNKQISVKAIGFITVGHALHHRNILEERYV
ncbi:MAG: DinB family protein [Flavisolibacter sp.]|nr:DinB family protein [Flavisolibacter sp.]